MDQIKNTMQNQVEVHNPFALSIGDLMAALLLIFILLLTSTLLRLQDEFEDKSQIAERYTSIKANIYLELLDEFRDDLEKWNAEIDQKDLAVRFKEPDVLFDVGSSRLKNKFKLILLDFFPRYIDILYQQAYRNSIEELRIEGHTSTFWNKFTNEQQSYIYNMRLSQDRTLAVLEYILKNAMNNRDQKSWTRAHLTANGLSSSKPIADNNTSLGKRMNRRVEFKIRTNAEQQIDKILNVNHDVYD